MGTGEGIFLVLFLFIGAPILFGFVGARLHDVSFAFFKRSVDNKKQQEKVKPSNCEIKNLGDVHILEEKIREHMKKDVRHYG
jgi:hypothetical protein